MKQILVSIILLMGMGISYAGNGDGNGTPSCNCTVPSEVNIYAAGVATLEGGNMVKCTGETGTCWEVTYRPGGGWVLTIYLDPPIVFGNSNKPDNPPTAPVADSFGDNWKKYSWTNEWKRK